jgi:hypothetical protein
MGNGDDAPCAFCCEGRGAPRIGGIHRLSTESVEYADFADWVGLLPRRHKDTTGKDSRGLAFRTSWLCAFVVGLLIGKTGMPHAAATRGNDIRRIPESRAETAR